MKLKIKVKEVTEGCMPEINSKGDWIDLKASKDMNLRAAQAGVLYKEGESKFRDITTPVTYIPLGVSIELPKGFEAIIASRSGGPKKLGVCIPSGIGVIDNSYNGDEDEWNYIASPLKQTFIKKGDRICQFRIQLSQKATIWQKLKWLCCSGIKLVKVDRLNNTNRGMNITGIK